METTQEQNHIDDEHAFSKMSDVEIASWISEALRRPGSFMYMGDNEEMFETWSLGPTIQHRDSPILDKSNAAAMISTLEADPTLADDWYVSESSHWGVGWVEQLSFKVVDTDGKPSRVARVIKGMMDSLEEYPVLDDSAFSEMEHEATLKNIGGHYKGSGLHDDTPDDWGSQMLSWFWDNDQDAVENSEGGGGYPSDKQFEKAARALGFWDTSEDESESE